MCALKNVIQLRLRFLLCLERQKMRLIQRTYEPSLICCLSKPLVIYDLKTQCHNLFKYFIMSIEHSVVHCSVHLRCVYYVSQKRNLKNKLKHLYGGY